MTQHVAPSRRGRRTSKSDQALVKILVAYDGSDCADQALADLDRAGLPQRAQIRVICVAEPQAIAPELAALGSRPGYWFPDDIQLAKVDERRMAEERTLGKRAARALRIQFPKWRISAQPETGPAGPAIVKWACEWKPNLLVMGSHGRSGLRQLILGSVSHYVLRHTSCPVHIGRHVPGLHGREIRLLVATDGSNDATAAVRAVCKRQWPAGTQVCVLGIVDPGWEVLPAAACVPPGAILLPETSDTLTGSLDKAVNQAITLLTAAGLSATGQIRTDLPSQVLIDQAAKWQADCIFLGARGLNPLHRLLLGSVSSAVTARANCSVEVVRLGPIRCNLS